MTRSDRTSNPMMKAFLLGGYLWLISYHVAEAANTTSNEITTCASRKPVKETIDGCTKVISLPNIDEPTRRTALLIRGNAYLSANELELASADYVNAQKISYSIDVSFGLGSIYINSGKSDEAIVEFSKIIDAGEGSANVFNHRGMAFENAGKYEEAISDFNKALFLAPNLLGPLNNRAAAYAKQGNWEAATKDIDAVLSKNPDMSVALVNRCAYQAHAGNSKLVFNHATKLNIWTRTTPSSWRTLVLCTMMRADLRKPWITSIKAYDWRPKVPQRCMAEGRQKQSSVDHPIVRQTLPQPSGYNQTSPPFWLRVDLNR
jgi:tetratricopeptide (TPR) repeat protein